MKQQSPTKPFAFQLAEKTKSTNQWKVRKNVAVAGCSLPDYRADHPWTGRRDAGMWC
ncbi:hypothetical protein GCM10009092_22640 [Bowmanella denitrificans]|uniref:Uncharacterized protein n=1 Tax=Bowmanella denitrificans TaxID=366582 RepID=A0ABP3GYC6_9ALTE|nr:hypothetical protein [Bowmanella denitrificans]